MVQMNNAKKLNSKKIKNYCVGMKKNDYSGKS